MGNGSESGEVVMSPVRAGIKRELAMLLKAQAESSVSIDQRRITRSQNVVLSNGKRRITRSQNVALTDGLSSSPRSIEKVNSPEKKKRKKEVTSEEVIMLSEEEEPKSDVVDGDEDVSGNVEKMEREEGTVTEENAVEIEMENGIAKNETETGNVESRTKIEMENAGLKNDEMETSLVKDEVETKANVVKEILNNHAKVNDNCKVVDGINVGAMEPKPEVFPVTVDSQDVELKPANDCGPAAMNAKGIVENGFSQKPCRRFTRSALKQKGEAAEVSRTGNVNVLEPLESDAVIPLTTPTKMEMKMSKKVELKRSMIKLKELLETGLLEGLPVRYLHGPKVKGQADTGVRGIIKGSGILCYCEKCNGNEVVSPNQFELHAGSSNKRPPEYIYLENGNSLRDVLNVCKNTPLGSLEFAVQNAIGCSSAKRSIFCLNCKGPIPEGGTDGRTLLCNSCVVPREPLGDAIQVTNNRKRASVCVSDKKSSDQISSRAPRSKSQGRVTRKDLRMHRLVFEEDVLPDGTALAYYSRGEKYLEGYKKGFGIFCYCCDKEVSPSQFEAHAGHASRRKPYDHIYTSNGVSLHELSIKLSKERKLSAEENDDLCSICLDGGDLLCCDNCPRAFHPECVSLPSIPQDTWYCNNCQNIFHQEKFVGCSENAVAAGRIAGIDPLEQITKRCIRIVETMDADVCSCVLCRGQEFSKTGFGPLTVIICDQCEKEYHIGCLQRHNMDELKELPKGKWFCCGECNGVHSALEKLIADGEMNLQEVVLDIIRKKQAVQGEGDCPPLDIRWRLLRGKLMNEDTSKFLSDAVTVLHEQFDPIADSKRSSLDLIPQLVYGGNFKDQDLGGMYTAILRVNSLVVSVGVIRIFGQEFAEIPLVATSSDHQGQGYFQCLFTCIENLLGSLNVKEMVLPAAPEAEAIWINKFGFKKMTNEELREYRKDYQMMIFQGTSVLHKSLRQSSVEPIV